MSFVNCLPGFVCLLAAAILPAAEIDLSKVLKGVEERYNNIKTLQLDFEQTYVAPNRARRIESGKLYLRKPGRMRWEYVKPDGKLFVSNGKDYWYYSPMAKRAEKMKLKEAEDMQAPLAFLIGRLDFSRDFGKFLVEPAGDKARITAEPKNLNRSPYREVSFLVGPAFLIEQLKITGQDASVMEFKFGGEVRNPPQPESMYQFVPPPGVEVVTPQQQ